MSRWKQDARTCYLAADKPPAKRQKYAKGQCDINNYHTLPTFLVCSEYNFSQVQKPFQYTKFYAN